jgi:hypothetical protein
MTRWLQIFACTALAATSPAQQPQELPEVPVGVVSGYLSNVTKSSFQVRTPAGKQYRCTYDYKTWFEHTKVRVSADAFQPTDLVEIVADRRLIEGAPCYARTVRLSDPLPKETGRMRVPYRATTEHIIPRGEFSWSGIIASIKDGEIRLRTRNQGYKTLLIRNDTRFLEDGGLSSQDRLQTNQHIFVRAGRNVEGLTEVYQVIWGSATGSPQ